MIVHMPNRRAGWASTPPMEPAEQDQRRGGEGPSPRWSRPQWIGQAVKYSAVGVLNTGLDAALYLVLTHWLGLGGLKILAKGISYSVGTVNSFHWNRSWTFRSKARAVDTFLPFVASSLLALAINAGAMYLGLELFRQYELPALAMATGVTLLWNFGVNKLLVFRR